jgi:hypothetical protein
MAKRFFYVVTLALLVLSMAACGVVQFQTGPLNMVRGSGNVIKETRTVSGFDSVQLTTSGDAEIIQGSTEDVVIEAEDNIVPLIETNVVNGKLVIGMKSGTSISTMRGMHFTIHAKNVNGIELNGSGNVSTDSVKSETFRATLTGSGDLKIGALSAGDTSLTLNGSGAMTVSQMQATAVHVRDTGSGNVRLSGQATDLDVNLNGSGNFEGADLKVQNAAVTTTGSGNVKVWVLTKLDARTSGSGDVSYYGQPTVTQNATGSGRVRGMGNK